MNIQHLWNDIITQNKDRLPVYFKDDAVILWPCTNEQFTVKEYVKANCEYPGIWKGEIERLENLENEVILVGHVYSNDDQVSCHVVSFITLLDNKIIRMEEYWADDGEAPTWRREMRIGKPIR